MPYPLDDWQDWLRLLNLLLGLACIYKMMRYRVSKHRRLKWTVAVRDEWWIWMVWLLVATGMSIEGLVRNIPMSSRPFWVFVIQVVTYYMVFVKHRWDLEGVNDDRN